MHRIKKLTIQVIISIYPLFAAAQKKDINYFLEYAVNNSPLLNEYRSNILIAGVDSALVIAAGRFTVTGNSTAFYAPVINGWGYDKAITNGQQLSALVAVHKQMYNKRNLSLQLADIQLQKDSLRVDATIAEKDLRKNIIAQYITAYSDQLQSEFNQELYNLLQRQEAILKKLTRQNVYRQVDYLSFAITVQQQYLAKRQIEIQHMSDVALLNYLAGITDSATQILLEEPRLAPTGNNIDAAPAFLLKYTLDSLRLANSKAFIALGYRPKISFFADAGYQSSLDIIPYKNFGTNIGINLSIPIYDGKLRKLQYAKLGIQEQSRQKSRDFFSKQYYRQTAQLRQQLLLIESLAPSINNQIKFLKTLIEANGMLLETGNIRITDYILSLNNYITAKNLLIQNRINSYQIINQLNYWNK